MPSLDPRDHNWDRELEKDGNVFLPDCRVRPIERDQHRFKLGSLVFDQVYCAECGKPWGGVTPNSPHVFYLCDDCARGYKPPAGVAKLG